MKATAIIAIWTFILLTACGNENAYADLAGRPVDAWTPFVQVTPPQGIWEVRTFEAVNIHRSTASSSPTYHLDYHMITPEERLFRWREYEMQRAFNFFFPEERHFFTSTAQVYPDFFGGFELTRRSAIVMIVEGKEYEAYEFLTYLENFTTIEVLYVPRSFNEIAAMHRLITCASFHPRRWRAIRNHQEGVVIVELFDYTEKEKAFFRENILNSPFVQFRNRNERI